MTDIYRMCCIIPCYNNVATIQRVARRARQDVNDVFIVNDGSNSATGAEIAILAADGFHVVTREQNGGKGAAVKSGFEAAFAAGFTHGMQIDADGQHDLEQIAPFLETSRHSPQSLLLGHPIFDDSAPLGRRLARNLTLFWTHVETLGRKVVDPMCGFRVYPLADAISAGARGDRMDFDIEIAVKMVRNGSPVINLPIKVRYLDAAEGGLSNFRLFWDNVAISMVHTRLVFSLIPWLFRSKKPRELRHE